MKRRALPWPLRALLALVVLAALLLACRWLSAFVVGGQLTQQARATAQAIRSGQPLWTWTLRRPQDVVAGRAFGAARLAAGNGALLATSRDGRPFELGLPIARSVDLRDWPRLRLDYQADLPPHLQLLVRAAPAAMVCRSAPIMLPASAGPGSVIDLRALGWRGDGDRPCTEIGSAWMLRLRWSLPAGRSIRLSAAALVEDGPLQLADTPVAVPATGDALPDLHELPPGNLPWFALPSGASAETLLAWRDRLQARWPAALIVPAGVSPFAPPRPAMSGIAGWGVLALYIVLLIACRSVRLHARARAAIDLAACLAGPVWLIAGLHWGGPGHAPAVAATLAALAYALSCWRLRAEVEPAAPLRGGRIASRMPGWIWGALAPVGVAVALGLGLGHGFAVPSPGHAVAYLAWAALQQAFCLLILLPRCRTWLGNDGLACLAVGALFALMHTPNGALMQCCLLAETWWAFGYLRWRRFWPVVIGHAAAALLLEASLTGILVRSLEVSARFLQ